MKQFIVVLLALISVGSTSYWEGGFRIKFNIGTDFGGSFFYDIPRTLDHAISEGWELQDQPEGLPVTSVSMYCYSDLIICCFYGAGGNVAGLQVALPQDKFTPTYDMAWSGFTDWIVEDRSFWTLQQYFTTEEILSSNSIQRNINNITDNGGVWVTGVNKELVLISNSTNEIVSEGVFTKQACIPWMGTHYFYNLTTETSCTEEPIFPWFGMVDSGQLVATGLNVFGKLDREGEVRNWYENADRAFVQRTSPDAPECMYDLVDQTGGLTLHIYYIDKPWMISCMFSKTFIIFCIEREQC